uniref:Uncharacterized protein n=1 Tax=Phasianus colchicus TaxID=9054 RepID=A0A669QTE8_PHACC
MWDWGPHWSCCPGLWGLVLCWAPIATRCRLQKTFTPNIISRKIKEEPREDVSVKKEKKERERQRDGHSRGRGRPDVIQSHSIFEQ